uniref:Alkaline phosphatase n=1 Tax=Ciona savignyi TaxID=51511 RepID=H2ZE59_CIOSA
MLHEISSLFLGDGMSITTITAGRIMKGQLDGKSGEEVKLAMDQFQFSGLSKTYSVDQQVSDSACTATAYLCGVKSDYSTLGLNGNVEYGVCSSQKGNEVESTLVKAYNAGKSTGIVTTRVVHASPAGAYAHSASRSWYGDADMPAEAKAEGCKDIAQQLMDSFDMITVALGGGRQYFRPNTVSDEEYDTRTYARKDGKDLLQDWETKYGKNAKFVWNQTDFDAIDPVTTEKLLGMFEQSDMKYEALRNTDKAGEPSLAEMTEKAIRMLQKNSKGYFLFVEGGRIDHGHHAGNAHLALRDLVAFDDAIKRAVDLTVDSDTLIVVTADHAHTLSMGGYSDRGNPILGLAPSSNNPYLVEDGKPYTTLLYANGPGFQGSSYIGAHERENLTDVDTESVSYLQQSSTPLSSETHGGDDVAILARGPMAHLFHGVHEQSYIPHAMWYASCIGDDTSHCSQTAKDVVAMPTATTTFDTAAEFLGINLTSTDTVVALYVQFVLVICLALFILLLLQGSKRSSSPKSPGVVGN